MLKCLTFFFVFFPENSWQGELDPYVDKPRVTFREDGTFKLTVFSDLHYGENPSEDWGANQDCNSSALLTSVLADEMPDFA